MRLIFTTQDYYIYAGCPRLGFPLILGDDMTPAQPFQDYLHHYLMDRGKALDVKTWEAYGRRLWDFVKYLHANDLKWDQPFCSHGQSVVRTYRDWQAHDLKLEPSTINDRLKTITHFYSWALEQGFIARFRIGAFLRLGADIRNKHQKKVAVNSKFVLTRNIRVAPALGDTSLSRTSRKHSSRRPWDSAPSCTVRTHRRIDRHRSAWFPVLHGRTEGTLMLTQE